jgi:hypothetical protein
LQSKANPGRVIKHSITADQSFIDDAGSSEIIGNLFGATTGVAWANDVPFYLYAVVNDDGSTIQFMISRIPNRTTAPAVADIGAPDDAVADNQYSFFSLDNIDETAYDGNPCACIGSFRMQMSSSDDWTVQTLSTADGIGRFHEETWFTFPAGQNGATSGKYFVDGGGTSPVFSTNEYQYNIAKSGLVTVNTAFTGDGGTDGAGAVSLKMSIPLDSSMNLTALDNVFCGSGTIVSTGWPSGNRLFWAVSQSDPDSMFAYSETDFVEYQDLANGARSLSSFCQYLPATS